MKCEHDIHPFSWVAWLGCFHVHFKQYTSAPSELRFAFRQRMYGIRFWEVLGFLNSLLVESRNKGKASGMTEESPSYQTISVRTNIQNTGYAVSSKNSSSLLICEWKTLNHIHIHLWAQVLQFSWHSVPQSVKIQESKPWWKIKTEPLH